MNRPMGWRIADIEAFLESPTDYQAPNIAI
jgi:hypothetical protein